jgi:hypothetical protein
MQEIIRNHNSEFEQIKQIVMQYDQELSLKANKAGYFEIEKAVKDNN